MVVIHELKLKLKHEPELPHYHQGKFPRTYNEEYSNQSIVDGVCTVNKQPVASNLL